MFIGVGNTNAAFVEDREVSGDQMLGDKVLVYLLRGERVVWDDVGAFEDAEDAVYAISTVLAMARAGEVQKGADESQAWVFDLWFARLNQLSEFEQQHDGFPLVLQLLVVVKIGTCTCDDRFDMLRWYR